MSLNPGGGLERFASRKIRSNGSKPPPGTRIHQNNTMYTWGKPFLFKLFSTRSIKSNIRSILIMCNRQQADQSRAPPVLFRYGWGGVSQGRLDQPSTVV